MIMMIHQIEMIMMIQMSNDYDDSNSQMMIQIDL